MLQTGGGRCITPGEQSRAARVTVTRGLCCGARSAELAFQSGRTSGARGRTKASASPIVVFQDSDTAWAVRQMLTKSYRYSMYSVRCNARRKCGGGGRRCALSEGPGRFIWGKQRRAMAALPTGPRETQSVLKAWRRKARAGPGISQACHDGMHISANRQPAGLWPTEKPCRPSCCDWGSGDLRCRLLHAWMVVRGAAQGLMPVDG